MSTRRYAKLPEDILFINFFNHQYFYVVFCAQQELVPLNVGVTWMGVMCVLRNECIHFIAIDKV